MELSYWNYAHRTKRIEPCASNLKRQKGLVINAIDAPKPCFIEWLIKKALFHITPITFLI